MGCLVLVLDDPSLRVREAGDDPIRELGLIGVIEASDSTMIRTRTVAITGRIPTPITSAQTASFIIPP